VEANEALRRIIVRHRLLLVVCVLLSTLAVVATYKKKAPTFTATARVQAQSAQPSSDTEADAILNRVKAVATSQGVVQAAVSSAHLSRDPAQVARNITGSRISSSAVINLTVKDTTRAGAVALADALAPKVVTTLNQLSAQQTEPLVAEIDQQRQELTNQRDALAAQLNAAPTAAGAQVLASEVSSIDSTLANLLVERQQLLASSGSTASAAVIDVPSAAKGTSSGLKTRALLAMVLGLVIGLLIATVHELLRPTVSRPLNFGHELGVPLLGTLQKAAGGSGEPDATLLTTLQAAAARTEVSTLVLTGPVPDEELFEVADRLDDMLASPPTLTAVPASNGAVASTGAAVNTSNASVIRVTERAQAASSGVSGHLRAARALTTGSWRAEHALGHAGDELRSPGLQVVALPAVRPTDRTADHGLVAVVPDFAPHAALGTVADLRAATGWPLLGVIGCNEQRSRSKLGRKQHQ
jgi:capsular polysaccharide biosynthesis protein